MPNEMRDRLIELMQEAKEHPEKTCPRWELPTCGGCDYDKGDECDRIARLADFLLKNGVIVPPCKVGDTVYIPWKYDGLIGIAFFEVTHIIVDRNKSYIKTNFATDDEGFYELYNGGEFVFDDFGKTVFLTREEAEQALKEGADNG